MTPTFEVVNLIGIRWQSGCGALDGARGASVDAVTDAHDGRRRAGDATRERIDQLADGWSLPARDAAPAGRDVDTDATRVLDDDETAGGGGPGPAASARGPGSGLRPRGLLRDVRYLFAGGLRLRRARRERDQLEHRLIEARARRARAVVALAAQAVSTASLEHPALDDARAELAILEHDHGDQARARAETDAAMFTLRRAHEAHGQARLAEITEHERTLAELATREAPLEREVARVRQRQADLAAELDRLDAARSRAEAQRDRRPASERAAVDAELATGAANRAMVARDRPALDAELAALLPQLAAIEAARAEAQARLDTARTAFGSRAAQVDAELRTLASRRDLLARAGDDARGARGTRLAALGERLVLERPAILRGPIGELDELDVAIATDQRRLLDVDETIDGVDHRAMLRGVAVLLFGLAALLAVIWLAG